MLLTENHFVKLYTAKSQHQALIYSKKLLKAQVHSIKGCYKCGSVFKEYADKTSD